MSSGNRDPAKAWPAYPESPKLRKWHIVTSEAILYLDESQKKEMVPSSGQYKHIKRVNASISVRLYRGAQEGEEHNTRHPRFLNVVPIYTEL